LTVQPKLWCFSGRIQYCYLRNHAFSVAGRCGTNIFRSAVAAGFLERVLFVPMLVDGDSHTYRNLRFLICSSRQPSHKTLSHSPTDCSPVLTASPPPRPAHHAVGSSAPRPFAMPSGGLGNGPRDIIIKIAKALGVSVQELLRDKD
jgi:hypothetical protein